VEQQDRRETKVTKEDEEHVDVQELLVSKDRQERREREVSQDHKVYQDHQVVKDHRDHLGLLVNKEPWVHQDLMENPVQKVRREEQGQTEDQVLLDDLDLTVPMVSTDDQERTETEEHKVYPDHVVFQDPWVKLDHQEHQEYQDNRDEEDFKERKERPV